MDGTGISGVIYPPPEVKTIIDKTASFVARNGKEFEGRIRAHEKENPKFKFLETANPYNAYYEMKINEVKKKLAEEEAAAAAPAPEAEKPAEEPEQAPAPAPAQNGTTAATTTVPATAQKAEPLPKENPCPQVYTVVVPADITALDMDVIKLTAQYVARNGQSFLSNITGREHRNMQFDFLKGTHRWFPFFSSLVDSYTKILIPPKGTLQTLRDRCANQQLIMKTCAIASEWQRAANAKREAAEAEEDQQRIAFQLVDWHDFVVVETIEFNKDDEEEPAPGPKPAEEEPAAPKLPTVEFSDDEDEDEGDAGAKGTRKRKAGGISVVEDGEVQVRDAASAPARHARGDAMRVVDPQTGQLVDVNQMSEHMRIKTLDPKWKEQQKREREKQATTNIAPDSDMSSALQSFASRRTDIFGDVEGAVGDTIAQVQADVADKPARKGLPPPPPGPPPKKQKS
eukprot:NODE_2199_length_1484_cov_87.675974_g2090_i0.p1 GENE.NODE_2199_length_1484_cov_87.675974_g2090_i0~~NODE_2199_length_1484_cov_87.675974_g2090_i0.p1  ORF type:complete len:475 (-),score=147.45 NODE_2199_length_1484_cov_87.675974_g2090_i0:58-1425(-)